MLPSVAQPPSHHFLPHNHLDHDLSFDPLHTLYDGATGALYPNQRHGAMDQHSAASLQPTPASRVQYMRPIQRPNPRPTIGAGQLRDVNGLESTLRRKTPSGTLAAGYDATDSSVQPPASKHILVSSLENDQLMMPRAAISMDTLQYKSLDPPNLLQRQNFAPDFKADANRLNALHNAVPQGAHHTNWIRSLNYPQSIESVLQHSSTLTPSQRVYWQNIPAIPTVLASSFQPGGRGSADSAGLGQYGPYWPDGGYIPYRPAAFRDSRYQSIPILGQSLTPDNTNSFPRFQPSFASQSINPPEIIPSGLSWNTLAPQPNQAPHTLYNPEPLDEQRFPPRHPPQKAPEVFWNQNGVPFAPTQPTNQNTHQIHPIDNSAWQTQPLGLQSGVQGAVHQPRNAEFKEKILAWAHSVYVDLLASLHNARRKSAAQGISDARSRDINKPCIFPKPPRQPGSDFSQSSHLENNRGPPFPVHQQHSVPAGNFIDTRRHSTHFTPSHIGFPHHGQEGRGHFTQQLDGFRTIRRSSAASVPRMLSPAFKGVSAAENAASALEILSSLCIESNWDWIDGMLVGGCLAYGLGDYPKAMRWYNRIINKDPSHVEAISNLAATLLALERRDEALEHWFRAIKLRPSYFEAVEHLVGLLCSSQRGKDAVNVIQFVEQALRLPPSGDCFKGQGLDEDSGSESEGRESSVSVAESIDRVAFDYADDLQSPLAFAARPTQMAPDGFGSSGYAIPGSDNGRMIALIHAKGNMLYALGDNVGAAAAFEDAILIGAGRPRSIKSLIRKVLSAYNDENHHGVRSATRRQKSNSTLLLFPDKALQTAKLVFPPNGNIPGLQYVPEGMSKKAAISTTSNSLLSLAKIYQDGMSNTSVSGNSRPTPGVRDILALYYLSLSLQPSPSTANNVGILLASIQNTGSSKTTRTAGESQLPDIPGVVPGSGIALALAYYNYGLNLDSKHAHLYTNLGSLLKDIGQLPAAIKMYEQAVQCDGNFDIALANLANAVKDSGRINDAIGYYRRAVNANPDFAEAVCGLANALNSVCNWGGRGGIAPSRGIRDRWHVDDNGMPHEAKEMGVDSGWIKRVVDIVDKQLKDGELWGCGVLMNMSIEQLCLSLTVAANDLSIFNKRSALGGILQSWAGKKWEGSRIVRLIERAIRWIGWQWYQDLYIYRKEYNPSKYARPQLPAGLSPPNAPTVLPFHTFTCPLSAKQIRHISQRNGLRISCSTLRSPWLPPTVYPPPAPPNPHLNIGYVSSDFNNHPLAHLMQSVFGLHNPKRVKAFCYATTASDNSIHRQQIEREAPVFRDVSSWSVDRIVEQIVADGIHILVNLNGYTRGARNEVFAARPAPIHMSFMGFAGSLGAEWCDYILSDQLSIPPDTLSPLRRNVRLEDRLFEPDHAEDADDWVYGERIVFTRHTFFCCDHRQSAPDAQGKRLTWEEEQRNRWEMRKELFPNLPDDTIIFGNFNQLYKIEPTTFRSWLRILARIPNAILWLLRFPDLGEQNLRQSAVAWAGEGTASRIIFTDVAPKHAHISRARICDLFLDTPECNAHTTSADILWSGTPLITLPRYKYKMCSRMASSILTSALPQNAAGREAAAELITSSEEEYENNAIRLGLDMKYDPNGSGRARGRLFELRKMLFLNRWESKLFDTRRWVNDVETAYEAVWRKWVKGEEGDIWL
ncbi:hypothetical protein D8B26_004031 [Coccidioides posadasii str. Silveira]|uniref:protein O-GlcNAc transferase n=2 Tax=Coccidioides posadasii TaxID=199306 RepID=C5P0Z9_COCP7|nr:TPR Domain containing protein [Coccidioides posadasii C735 delta SOWgp]EER29357.1 TPR Domain containing protein [Coccidioides posadasii C735 delta SOWgp]QVM09370.1 hypothetical protein D8B26_004031 [Coccidioides posadasii str. Silveira]|eukprot:XP_003071502.1 TPR Domain containing protein [Coccidioides posadasii C735 delta SOWgp]